MASHHDDPGHQFVLCPHGEPAHSGHLNFLGQSYLSWLTGELNVLVVPHYVHLLFPIQPLMRNPIDPLGFELFEYNGMRTHVKHFL